jgi:sterol desaturase/sphingolipid hydroxylase (fatty acid hydroxylase superfamily)
LLVGVYLTLRWLERRRPLRAAVDDPQRHTHRNLALAAVGGLALQLVEAPAVRRACQLVERRSWGLLRRFALPHWFETALAMLLLDYSLYVWHVLLHRVTPLWRFHIVHHIDLDLDASTAVRFHCAELVLSVPWRVAAILIVGAGRLPTALWQTATLLSILFHHANVRLPVAFERWLVRLIVTPRMHTIHHAAVRAYTDSNWSSVLTLWDRVHGTLRLNVAQDAITIGVPAYPRPVSAPALLHLPFQAAPPTWEPVWCRRAAPTPCRAYASVQNLQ